VSLTGFSPSELTSLSVIDGNSADDSLTQALKACENGNDIREKITRIKRRDGSKFPGILTMTLLQSEDNDRLFVVTISEATQLVNNIERLEKANASFQIRENLKDEFIAVASHELRTPIQPILGLALLAKKGRISQEEAWEQVLREARRLQQLANDILDVSRIETGNLTYRMQHENITDIIEAVVKTLRASEYAEKVSINLTIGNEVRSTNSRLDRSRITQLLLNIIGNAVKFTGEGDVDIKAEVNREKNRIEIFVSDTGGGIPDDILRNLFKKFVTKGVGDTARHGSGLGLYISRAIISAHDGNIYVCNNEKKGATFAIHLPIK
jgi:signal transduction histidine kinase